jgi:hypothetical protein
VPEIQLQNVVEQQFHHTKCNKKQRQDDCPPCSFLDDVQDDASAHRDRHSHKYDPKNKFHPGPSLGTGQKDADHQQINNVSDDEDYDVDDPRFYSRSHFSAPLEMKKYPWLWSM